MSRERIMLTQAIPAVQQLRRVQGFDPLRFLKRNANGGIELEPRYQRLWFRLACPDGKMLLNRLRITDQIAVYEAQVFLSREDNQPITNFTAAVEKAQAPAGRYVQAAQDEALKTALDNAGFGIQLCEINPSAAVDMPQKAQEVPSETAEPAVMERAETARTLKPVVVDMPAAASTAAAPKYSDDMTVDEILSLMTEEEAAELVVTTGVNKGWTMAQVSEQRPSSLKYYAYLCEDCGNIMKAAAMLLMGGSQQLKAS